ncbi:MAG TPA: ABC transporter permease [Verrucomicrobiota bacterium]|nr:ABC transporter permease [Verrucomicrobiota bacterium]HPU55592.1 ABC transporter permease [Verrucomicrobiota bacterium]
MNSAVFQAATLSGRAKKAETAMPLARSKGRLRQIRRIAAREFGDRLRSGWVIACVPVWLGAIGLTSFLGLLQIGRIGVQGYERTVVSLLNLVQYLVPLLGLLLGHDLIVAERENGTLRLLLASGVTRLRLLLGKLLGGWLTLTVPLVLGFAIAGTVIGLTARDGGVGPFVKLAISALALGLVFVVVGLALSAFTKTRVQALVTALLVWCVAVFAFDLVALGIMVSTQSAEAAAEIELICDTTHVNAAAADLHAAYESGGVEPAERDMSDPAAPAWLALNPVSLFRAVNLPSQTGVRVPAPTLGMALSAWLVIPLWLASWRTRQTDF